MKRDTWARLEALERTAQARERAVISAKTRQEVEQMIERIKADPEPMDPQEADRIMAEIMDGARLHYGFTG